MKWFVFLNNSASQENWEGVWFFSQCIKSHEFHCESYDIWMGFKDMENFLFWFYFFPFLFPELSPPSKLQTSAVVSVPPTKEGDQLWPEGNQSGGYALLFAPQYCTVA